MSGTPKRPRARTQHGAKVLGSAAPLAASQRRHQPLATPESHRVPCRLVPGHRALAPFRPARHGSSRNSEVRSEEHTSELQSRPHLVCRLLLEKKKNDLNFRYTSFNTV